MTAPVALEVAQLRKTYGGNHALAGVDLEVRAGEVHALLGQNGCGKSTLVKSLTGVVRPDGGEVRLFGQPLELPVTDPSAAGIAVIHQDIGLVDTMTVLENLGVIAGYGARLLGPVRVRREREIAHELMARLEVDLDLDAPVSRLSPAERALLGVVRAFRSIDTSRTDQLFILDEPTAALSGAESTIILRLMRRMADLGFAVVFISHRLQEVMESCDRATVLRAGTDVLHTTIADTTRAALVAAMLGRRMEDFFPAPPSMEARRTGTPRLVVEHLVGHRIADVSFAVSAGEVVGVTGLAGMGQEELPFLLSGAARPSGGRVLLDGAAVELRDPADAISNGIALVPGNRLRDGIWSAGTAEENITLPVLQRFRSLLGLRGAQLRRSAEERMQAVAVHPAEPQLPMFAFSGGNQQKVVFAKWLQLDPEVLLLHEPTQGVDPGSAKELLTDAVELASNGAAVLVFSGDQEQLAEICNRVLVLRNGAVVAELAGEGLTEENLLHACEGPVVDAA
jgi:ribose transport system ATP-binding protein